MVGQKRPGDDAPEIPRQLPPSPEIPGRTGTPGREIPGIPRPEPEVPPAPPRPETPPFDGGDRR